jgi:transcriptional regulator with XRE-family HTH domain
LRAKRRIREARIPLRVPDRAELAEEIRRLRAASGMSGVVVAERLGWSQSKVSKLETGRATPSLEDVRKLVVLYGVGQEKRDALETSTSELNDRYRSLRMLRKRGLEQEQQGIKRVESSTALLRVFEPSTVPGLLQTAEYARAVFSRPLSGAGVDYRADVRPWLGNQASMALLPTAEEGPQPDGVVFLAAIAQLASALDVLSSAATVTTQVQLEALHRIENFHLVWDAGLALFALHLLITGYLLLRTAVAPRLLGWLLVLAGIGYLVDSSVALLAPGAIPELALVTFVGEVWLFVWLLVKGRQLTIDTAKADP